MKVTTRIYAAAALIVCGYVGWNLLPIAGWVPRNQQHAQVGGKRQIRAVRELAAMLKHAGGVK